MVPQSTKTSDQKWRGHAAMLLFVSLIAASFSIGERAVAHITPGAITAARFLFATLVLGVVAYALATAKERHNLIRPKSFWRFTLLGALMGCFFITMFEALEITDPVSTGAVYTLMPLLTALFSYFANGQITKHISLISLLVAGCGSIWVIFNGNLNALLAFDFGRGEAIFFLGVAAHALYAALVPRFNRGESVQAFTLWSVAGAFFCVALYGAGDVVNTAWLELPAMVWAAIFYLSTFTTAVTFYLLQFAVMRIPAATATGYVYLTPTLIILLEGVFGGGWSSLSVIAGAVATIGGLAVLAFARDS